MVDAWPITLPQKLQRAGNSGSVGDGLVEYQPDYGPPIARVRTNAVVDMLGGNMNVSKTQLATLRSFYRSTLMQGALPFTFPDPEGGADLLVRFPKGKGPSWSEVGPDLYRVGITLAVLP